MKREKKEITVRRTAEGQPYQQDTGKVAAAEEEGWREYDRQGRPGLTEHGGWVVRLVREVEPPSGNEHGNEQHDDTPGARPSSDSTESTTQTEDSP